MVKRFTILSSVLVSLAMYSLPTAAQDNDSSPSWAGWHAGLNVGVGFADGEVSASSSSPFPASEIADFPSSSLETDPSGMLAGAQIGHDWLFGSMLVGVEADIQLSDVNGDATLCVVLGGCADPDRFTASQDLEWFSTLRARLGMPAGDFLIYVTGGLAVGEVDLSANLINGGPADSWPVSYSNVRVGWTVGAGTAVSLGSNASVGFEYLYIDLGDKTLTSNGTGPAIEPASFRFENQFHVGRVLLNLHF